MIDRRRFEQHLTLHDRLLAWAKQIDQDAAKLRPGPERDALVRKARQANVAVQFDNWCKSPGLQPPK